MLSRNLGRYQLAIQLALDDVRRQRIVERIWAMDHTVWSSVPDEIVNRLGWLRSPMAMRKEMAKLDAWASRIRSQGIEQVLLLGMGGSSLAPEVYASMHSSSRLRLSVLDSTHPDAIDTRCQRLDPARTLVIVSSKSGGTIETLSLFRYLHRRFAQVLGVNRAGAHFVAITDPGSALASIAQAHNFAEVFLNDPSIGGRYAALSLVGLVPAALLGVPLDGLLDRASLAAQPEAIEAGVRLGTILGELARQGRDKLTLLLSPSLTALGPWLEQLLAESTGKQGQGILPVDGEPAGSVDDYGNDRVFVRITMRDEPCDRKVDAALLGAHHPAIELKLANPMDVAAQFYTWMWATAIACQRLGVNAFDQPNVESAKALARQFVEEFRHRGRLPQPTPDLKTRNIEVYGMPGSSVGACVSALLEKAESGSYVAIHAYAAPATLTDAALLNLRLRIRRATKLATTAGYGPRLLHSTGQLHKGDRGKGLFIQICAEPKAHIMIPAEPSSQAMPLSFGTLIQAQAWGDYRALRSAGRHVLRLHIRGDVATALTKLMHN